MGRYTDVQIKKLVFYSFNCHPVLRHGVCLLKIAISLPSTTLSTGLDLPISGCKQKWRNLTLRHSC